MRVGYGCSSSSFNVQRCCWPTAAVCQSTFPTHTQLQQLELAAETFNKLVFAVLLLLLSCVFHSGKGSRHARHAHNCLAAAAAVICIPQVKAPDMPGMLTTALLLLLLLLFVSFR
jgi:chromate transport protein ChrA